MSWKSENLERYNAWRRKHYAANKDRFNRLKRQRRTRPEVIATEKLYRQGRNVKSRMREATKRYVKRHPDRMRSHWRKASKRRMSNPNKKILSVLRIRLWEVLKGTRKCDTTVKLLGCSVESFRIYLESNFEIGMNWGNYGVGKGKWQIDHIMPCFIFDLTKPRNQRRCFHFSNMRPMWASENAARSNRTRSTAQPAA